MSLELALAANTAALERLTAVMQSTSIASHDAAAASASLGTALEQAGTKARTTRSTKKDQPASAEGAQASGSPAANNESGAATSVTNDGTKPSDKLLPGDPEGTRYFHIAKHNTVAKVRPGEVVPSIPGTEEVAGTQYENWRLHYAAQATGSTSGNAAAANPAASSPSASTASSSTSAGSPEKAVDAPALMEKCKALHARDGNEGLRKVLDQFKAGKVGELMTQTTRLSEIAAFVDALLNPAPANQAASADLFN